MTYSPGIVGIAIASALFSPGKTAHAEGAAPWDGGTVAIQSAAGLGGLAIGGIVGFVAGGRGGGLDKIPAMLAAGVLTGTVGAITCVQLAGDAYDGTGRFWGTTVGAVAGAAAGVGVAVLGAQARSSGYLILGFAAAAITGGAVIGYHLTATNPGEASLQMPLMIGRF